MENTKNHGSQSHTKDNAADSKNKRTAGQGQQGKTSSPNASADSKMNKMDDAGSSNGKSGKKNGGSH